MNLKGKKKLIIGTSAIVLVISIAIVMSYGSDDIKEQDVVLEEQVQSEAQQDNGNEVLEVEGEIAETDTNTPEPTPKPEPSVEADIPALYEVFADYFPIGAAIEPHQTTGLKAELLKKHVNMLVAENAMKPSSLHPSEDNYNWTQADQIVAFAKENNMQLRFHTLVWHTQVGNWFFLDAEGKPMVDETDEKKREENKQLLLKRLDSHVRTIVSRYKDDIVSWDVVNEVIEPNDPDGMRASEWYQITGTSFIETAFHAAREAGGPDIKLYINDYGTDDPVKRERLFELVKELLDKGVPIDGVGHQTHINIHWPPVSSIIDSMKRFAELGLDNIVTELDMSLYTWNDRSDFGEQIPADVLNKQAERYSEIFNAFKENKDFISEVVFWGISDDHTWLSSFPIVRTEAPFLFDEQMHSKPAYWAIVDPSKLEQ